MQDHPVVTREAWLQARKDLLDKEKAFTRARDALSEERRALPWVRIDAPYRFEGPEGPRTLPELFGPRSQLLVYHFMFGADWDAGCPSCSFWADSMDRNVVHLAHRDIQLVVVSRAPWAKLHAYKARMGWTFPWFSSSESNFNQDFAVSFEAPAETPNYNFGTQTFRGPEAPGASAFVLRDGQVFHTYSTYARGLDMLNAAYHWMDIAPKGRDEASLPWSMAWLRRRDEYDGD